MCYSLSFAHSPFNVPGALTAIPFVTPAYVKFPYVTCVVSVAVAAVRYLTVTVPWLYESVVENSELGNWKSVPAIDWFA